MKIAHINENNKLLGWYDAVIHTSIPTPNIEVNNEVWQFALANNHNKVNADGTTEHFDFRTQEEIDKQNRDIEVNKARKYLDDTDWYVTRLLETTKAIPENILSLRAEARLILSEN